MLRTRVSSPWFREVSWLERPWSGACRGRAAPPWTYTSVGRHWTCSCGSGRRWWRWRFRLAASGGIAATSSWSPAGWSGRT